MYLELCVRSWRYCCRIARASNGLGQLGLPKSRPLREQFRGHSIGTPVWKSLWPFRIAYFCSFSKAMSSLGPSERSRQKSLPTVRLDLGSAAVNEQFDTRDEAGVIRSQKQRHLSNFLGFPHASHRDGGHNPRNHVCRLPTRQRRIDRTRTNNVRADATVLQICCPGSHERADCGLTRGVDAEGSSTLNTRDGAVENDRATIIQQR